MKITYGFAAAFITGLIAIAAVRGEDQVNTPIADGPFKATWIRSKNTAAPNGSAMPSSASGPIGVRRPCRWTATGTPAAFTSRAAGTTSTTWRITGILRSSAIRTSSRLWKAEKWDPDRLMQLYKKAGAKYFVSMGSHHDNFFLWNSKLHRWNAANMGPHARCGRRLAEGGQEVWTAVRRLGAPRRQLHLVPSQPRRPTKPGRRPACRTTARTPK